MTSIISVFHKGQCIGVCDARCYNAMPPSDCVRVIRQPCRCICGGANHSAGLAKAVKNREREVGLRRKDVERFADERGYNVDDLMVADRLVLTEYYARKKARALLKPPMPLPLFRCEALPGVSPLPGEEGSGAGASVTTHPHRATLKGAA